MHANLRKLNVSLLSSTDVDQAYPLVQAMMPGASIEAWRRFAEARLGDPARHGSGILIVHNEQQCIVGISAFTLSQDLMHGPILFADQFCALDIVGQPSVARALMRAIERLAEQHGCSAILTNLRQVEAKGRSGWISDVLYERGHWIAGMQMCKRVTAAG